MQESVSNIFRKFLVPPPPGKPPTKKPRVHPIIQVVSGEWRLAESEGRLPNWRIFTPTYIAGYCAIMKSNSPLCHPHLYAEDLSEYLQGLPERKKWWTLDPVAVAEPLDGPHYFHLYFHLF
jgi:hypothetical protein